ncbi:MAG TPA: hypothetical protein VKQ54_13850, partial [Caulobacteraceae bacterium]|nr:hypothetical protein [Caulobacteraceae bacterium]
KGTPGPWLTAAKFGSGDWTYDPDLEAKTARTARNTNYAQHYLMAFVLRSSDPQAAKHLTAKLEKLVVDQLDDARSRRIGAASRLTQLQNLYFRTVAVDPEEIHVSREGSDEHYFPREDLQVRATIATIYQRCRTLAPFADPRTPQDARRVLSNAFQPTQDWLETAARRVEGMSGVDPAPLRDFVDDFGRKITLWHFEGEPAMIPPYRSASVLGRWADQFAESVIAGFGSHLPEASLFALVGPRSDDPEWRAPLRAAFTAAIRSPEDIERVALTAATAMGQWCPYDLQYVPMMELIKGAPRTAWLRILEFLDRCRGLGALAEAFVNHPDHRLARSCRAYLDWDSCCDLLVEASRAAMPS